jgi:ABC-type transporter Mla MlaB component
LYAAANQCPAPQISPDFEDVLVFSTLFGKKKDKEVPTKAPRPNPPGPSAPAPAPPLSIATDTRSGTPTNPPTQPPLNQSSGQRQNPPANARELARATAEKIDKIESEMSLDFTPRPLPAGTKAPQRPPVAPVPEPQKKRSKRPDGGSTTLPSLGQTTDILLGDSILANAMEISDSASSPAIEEAAILYANGQPLPAVAVLSDAVRADSSGFANTQAWLMLFELYQVLGKRAEFENLAIDYAIRFETSSPNWSELKEVPSAAPPPAPPPGAPGRAGVAFKGALSNGIVAQLDQLKKLAQKNPVLHLNFGPVTSAEASGADLILRVFAAFQKSNHEVVIEGAENLVEKLMSGLEVGRRDASNAVWMLLLEMYRILGRQAAFEETSIDYCVTYEVSPPSWEPPSTKFRLGDAPAQVVEAVVAAVEPLDAMELAGDAVSLSGDLLGKAELELQRLSNFTADHRKIVVDCTRLRRVDFTAAGVLLNWAVGAQSANKSIEFREVSNLVAALLAVMGLHEVASIERRRF